MAQHIYLWNGSTYGTIDYIERLKSGRIVYRRPFSSLGDTEAILDIYCGSEAEAYSLFPKGLKVKITDDQRTGDFYDGSNLMIGYIERHNWNEDTLSVRVTLKDYVYLQRETELPGATFVNQTISQIISWVANKAGINVLKLLPDSLNSKYDPVQTHYFIKKGTKVQEELNKIVQDLGGKLYVSPGKEPHSLVAEFGCLYKSYSSAALISLSVEEAKNFNIDYPAKVKNVFEVKCKSKRIITDKVFIGATYDNKFPVPVEGTGTDPDKPHYIPFDHPVLKITDKFFDADSGITLDETVFNSNFVDNDPTGYLKDPYRMELRINNTSGQEGEVWQFWIKGLTVAEDDVTETKDNSGTDAQRKWNIESDLISLDQDWNKRRVTWEAAKPSDQFSLQIQSFRKDLLIGPRNTASSQPDYIVDVNGAKIAVEELTYNLNDETWQISGCGDRSSYDPTGTSGGETIISPVNPSDPEIGDGAAPDIPSGLLLSSYFSNLKSYVKASWLPVGNSDIKSYELAWSYDQTNWLNYDITGVETAFEVKENRTIYVKVRACDIEGLQSDYSAIVNITSATSSTAPTLPTAITVIAGYDIISVSWASVSDEDLNHYELQRAPSPYSSWSTVATVKGTFFIDRSAIAGIYYKYRIRSVDNYGNTSEWQTATSGKKTTSISSELSTLNGELSSLQTALNDLEFADIDGSITSIQITDNAISAPKIAANAVEAAKIKAGAVIAEKIGAGAITTEKLFAGAVTADKIAANTITANEIKAGEITTNELAAALSLRAGQTIEVGSLIKMGYGIFPTAPAGQQDGLLIGSESGNYIKYDGSNFEVKANLKVAESDNEIQFVDSGLAMVDLGASLAGGVVYHELGIKKSISHFDVQGAEKFRFWLGEDNNVGLAGIFEIEAQRDNGVANEYVMSKIQLGYVLNGQAYIPNEITGLSLATGWIDSSGRYSADEVNIFIRKAIDQVSGVLEITKPIDFPIPYYDSKPVNEPDSTIFMWDYGNASQCKIAHKISDGRWIYYYAMKPVSYSNL